MDRAILSSDEIEVFFSGDSSSGKSASGTTSDSGSGEASSSPNWTPPKDGVFAFWLDQHTSSLDDADLTHNSRDN
jgi:hypothetical protein